MKRKDSVAILLLVICFLASSCQRATPTRTATPEITTPEIITESVLPDPVVVQIIFTTSSDWSDLDLVSGATWQLRELVSTDPEVSDAYVEGNKFICGQSLERAESGQSIEMTAEFLLSPQAGANEVKFKILRGNIGASSMQVSRYFENKWVTVASYYWDQITAGGENAVEFGFPYDVIFGTEGFTLSEEQILTNPVSPVTGMPEGTDGYPWWNDSIFYEIFVRSFSDSDGDGIGDLNGITEKLDYLNDGNPDTTTDLGITGIWLMPIFESPSYHGYDVIDYYKINPQYGTLEDFKNLLSAAHACGIRVIIDFTFNHTSIKNQWFINSTDPSSTYHDWYIWSDADPGFMGPWNEQVWFPYNGMYYYSVFSANMADLNYKNTEVTATMEEIARYWLEDVGVDGFRLDAAKHIVEEGSVQANSDATHAWWKNFRTFYKEVDPQKMMVGEIWDDPAVNAAYVQGDELDLAFEFYLANKFIESVNSGNSQAAGDQMTQSFGLVPSLQLATFLTNHDQNRLMDQLGYDPKKVKVASSMLLTGPGVPFIYYGEEIGMQGSKPDERIRAPMQWSADPFVGFSSSDIWETPGNGWEYYNVAIEENNPESILNHYKNLIHIRNQHAALRVGDYTIVTANDNSLYSILRVSQEEAILVIVNLSEKTLQDYILSINQCGLGEGIYSPVAILGDGVFTSIVVGENGGFSNYSSGVEIPPYGTIILQLQKD